MTITVNTRAYALDGNTENTGKYVGPANTASTKDFLMLKRQMPKPTADFAGVTRVSMKFVRTLTLADASKWDAIVEVSASIPVGAVEADVDLIRDDMGDALLLTAADDLFWKQKILA